MSHAVLCLAPSWRSCVQRCGKIRQVILPTDDNMSNVGFAYVHFATENAVAKAMQLRPSQIRDKTIKRFKKAPNPYQKKFHRPYSFSGGHGGTMQRSLKSYVVADQQSEIDPDTLRNTMPRQNSGDQPPLSTQNSGVSQISNVSARQQVASARLSAGLSSVDSTRRLTGPALPGVDSAVAAGTGSLRESGKYGMPRPSSYGRLSSSLHASTRRRSARSTNDDNLSVPATPAAEMAPLPEHDSVSAATGQPTAEVSGTRDALTAESVPGARKTDASDKPIATLGPESEQVWMPEGTSVALL